MNFVKTSSIFVKHHVHEQKCVLSIIKFENYRFMQFVSAGFFVSVYKGLGRLGLKPTTLIFSDEMGLNRCKTSRDV